MSSVCGEGVVQVGELKNLRQKGCPKTMEVP